MYKNKMHDNNDKKNRMAVKGVKVFYNYNIIMQIEM
jgi:hypothetical protein